MAKRIQVGGRIESKEVGGIVTGAAEILDDAKEKKQSVINQETDDELVRLDQSKQDNLTFDNAPTEGSNNPVKSGGVYAADKALSDAIEAILLLIPSAASALNKLVDQATMNSSISTATATFRGTYNVVTDLELAVDATHEQIAAKLAQVVSEADNNDYAFVQVPVSAESTDIRRTERYKFNGTAWGYEYDLNTSGFTAAQWAAINSGITLALVGKLVGLPTSSELQALLGQKQDTLTFDNVPTAGSANPVKSSGVHTAINDEKTAREQLAQTVTGINGRVGDVEEVIPTGAAANNKLVANNSMEAYVTSIIEAITASFTIATADGHINISLTQTNGRVASLTLTSSDIASAQALTALTGRVSTAESNITTLGGRISTNETDIANLQQLYNDLQQSKPVPVTALPETGQQQGVIYRLAGTTSYSDYMWNGSTWVLMATYNNAIDPRPKKASQNLVTSGGVFDNIGALDVSELNATENPHTLAQYVDLSAALAAIPTDYQKGGMSIKFVLSSDNKYVQYRLMSDSFNTTPANWQGVDDEPTAWSENLVKSGGVAKYRVENSKLLLYTKSYLNGETGQKTYINDSNWSCSEFVELYKVSGNVISLNKKSSGNASSPKAASFVAYDENYNPVYISNSDGQTIYYKNEFPPTAKYVAFSFYRKTDVIVNNYSVWDSLNEISNQISVLHKPISNFGISPFWVDNTIWQNRNASYSAIMIPVIAGTTIKVTANANINTRIAFLNTYEPSNIIAGSTIDGEGNQNTLPNNTSTYIVPATCTYIALMNTYGGGDCLPVSLIIDGVEYMKPLSEIVMENMGRIIQNTSDIYQIKTNLEVVPQLSIVVGTIYRGNIITDSECLCATEYINVKGLKSISIIRATDIKVRITEYNSRKEYIKQSEYSFIDSFELDTETNYVRISASYTFRGYGESNPITTDAFTEGDFGISYIGNTDTSQTTIIDRNINKDASVRAVGIKAVSSDIKPLSFIHISDIHTKGDNYKCFESACEFYEHYSNIKFMIATGDLVWDTYHDPTTWYDKALASTSKPVLNVIGNHDAGQYNASYGLGSQSSDLECYNKFIAPYVNAGTLPNGVAVPGWGVVQPTNASTEGKSYYYKDFTDEKIRLIVLCEFETDYEINQEGTGLVYSREYRAMRQAQVTWLIDTLSSTPSDYGVIVAYHQPDNLADDDNEFVSFDLVGSYRSSHGQSASIAQVYCDDKEWLPKILNAFATKSSLTLTVTQTGAVVTSSPTLVCDCDFTSAQAEFICILNGHTHQDYIGHLTNFPALKVLCVGADNLLYTSSFQPREEGTPSEDLFNVVNIDRNRKTIKIIRIGSNASVTGQVRDQMIMSYDTN